MTILEQVSAPAESDGNQNKLADLPEEIRNLIDGDEWADLKAKVSGRWLYVEAGEIKAVEA